MGRGGARAGAGRKSDGELDLVRTWIDAAVSPEEWQKIFARLAKSKNPGAVALLMKYRFGLPVAPVDVGAVADELVHIWLPPVNGSERLGTAQGAAKAVPRKRSGRGAVRRGGGRGKK